MGGAHGNHNPGPVENHHGTRQTVANRGTANEDTGNLINVGSRVFVDVADRVLQGRRHGTDIYDDEKSCSNTERLSSDVNSRQLDINKRYPDGQTPLTAAIRDLDLTKVQEILQHPGVRPNFPEERQYNICRSVVEPPIIVATKVKHHEILKALLEAGADVDSRDSYGFTALHYAAETGDEASVSLLLQYGSAHAAGRPGKTPPVDLENYDPIHQACRNGHFGVVKMLMAAGCSADPKKESGVTSPLDLAIKSKNEDICLYLLQNGAKYKVLKEKYLPTFLHACLYGCNRVVEHLIARGIDVNMVFNQTSGFFYATRYGDLLRIARRGKLHKNNHESLQPVHQELKDVLCESVSVTELLCKAGGYIDRPTTNAWLSPVCLSLKANNLLVCLALLKHGASWDYACDQIFETNRTKRLQNFDRSLYLTLLHMLDNKRRYLLRPRDSCPVVQSLKHCCRKTIRNCILRYGKDGEEKVSVIPRLQELPLPVPLRDFLCYKELDFKYLVTHSDESYLNYLNSVT